MRKLSKKEWVAVAVAIAFIGYMFFGAEVSGLIAQLSTNSEQTMDTQTEGGEATGVQVQDVVVGNGTAVEPGKRVSVNYVLKLTDGTVLQDSKVVSAGAPFSFTLGVDRLIAGWEMGIVGMKTGGKRIIVVPPELGYGAQANGPIPANSTLVFEIEVVEVQ